MPGGALACVLLPRTLHAWPSLGAGHSVRGPACVGSHGATRGSHKGRGISRQNATRRWPSPLRVDAAEYPMDRAFVAG
jgi:hypothetical protein